MPFIGEIQAIGAGNQVVSARAEVSDGPNRHPKDLPFPPHGRKVPPIAGLLFAAMLLAAIVQSGCTGVTSASGNSTTSTAGSSNSVVLGASPTALDFGNVFLGSASNQSLTIANFGTSPITISQSTASGAGLTIGGAALPVILNPGNSATFTASFAPSTAGDVSGSISFMSPQLRQTFGVGWHGTGKAVTPLINVQPVSQSIVAGQTANFSVTANGTPPLSYQWNKNGIAISGAGSSSYTTAAETTSDNGAQFTVIVSNSAGNVTSSAAILSVTSATVAPSVTAQPISQTVTAGQTATFSVIATGTAPLSYQWQKNGAAISGATSASYTTPATTSSDNGALFAVVVSNSAGSIASSAATLTVNPAPVAPSITTQPASQTVTAGQTATFSVIATGTAPLSYQWQKNGTAISGASSASYTTPATTSSDNGAQFTVVVSNSVGTVTSSVATLTVNPAPVAPSITTQPASQTVTAGQTATFSVTATGTAPLSYQWQKNGTAISGASSASYTTPATTSSDNGAQFTVVVSNSVRSVTSSAATLTVNPAPVAPSITTQPISQTVTAGQTATFSVTATGTAPLSYQWQKNGAAISGATSASYTTPSTSSSDNGAQFTVVVSNSVGAVTSNVATLTINVPPSITTQPASQTMTAGQTATFSVTATGTAPLNYQWQKNGAAISGATSASYTTPSTSSSDNGAQFTVVVSNSVGTVTSNVATLTVNPAPVAPSITTQPASQTVTAGQTATFSVTATGTAPLSYQWQKNGAAISGATSASYTTPATTSSDNGAQFTVVVSNSVGTVTSGAATLTVNPAPVAPSITTQPASQTVTAGQTATFSVIATGTAPLSYQWQKNGGVISGATSSTYTTPATTSSDNGAQFTVVVTNSVGSVTSSAATLTVNPAPVAPSITTQPASQTVTAGQTATFSVTATGTAPLSYQWQKNGAAISGATSASYTTPATTSSDNGAQFTVVVSNSVGSVASSVATLTVTTPGQLSSSAPTLSFGNVNVGSSSTQSVTVTNTGGSNVSISNVTISGAGFSVNGISTGLILSPGATTTMNVIFAPAASGSVTGSVTITSNASNSPLTVSFSGIGIVVAHSATLNWTASTSVVAGYNVYRSATSGGPYTKINSSLDASTTFTDSSVLSGQTYYYVVTAVDSSNVESAYSNQVTAVIP